MCFNRLKVEKCDVEIRRASALSRQFVVEKPTSRRQYTRGWREARRQKHLLHFVTLTMNIATEPEAVLQNAHIHCRSLWRILRKRHALARWKQRLYDREHTEHDLRYHPSCPNIQDYNTNLHKMTQHGCGKVRYLLSASSSNLITTKTSLLLLSDALLRFGNGGCVSRGSTGGGCVTNSEQDTFWVK